MFPTPRSTVTVVSLLVILAVQGGLVPILHFPNVSFVGR